MNPIGTLIHTFLFGRKVGVDAFGNAYYEDRRAPKAGLRRARWVIYQGIAEPSKVPAEWHTWLHYTADAVPESTGKKYTWAKPHQPNLTGTPGAYLPQGAIQRGGHHAPATADYEPWIPS